MKLEEIKGKRQLQVVGKLMALADSLSDDDEFKAFAESMRDEKGREGALLKLGPLLTRDDFADGIVELVAFAKGVKPEEVENPVGEIMELVSSDLEIPAFLSEQR